MLDQKLPTKFIINGDVDDYRDEPTQLRYRIRHSVNKM